MKNKFWPSSCSYVSLKCLSVARKIDFENPEILNYVRIGYVASQLLTLGIYFYISAKASNKVIQPLVVF